MNALIVDDEEDIGLMVSRFLRKEGLQVSYADRINMAKEIISDQSFDFYLLDLHLPDGTGFDLIPKIKEDSSESKVIVISAHDGPDEMKKVRELGVDAFIKKPFTKGQVMEVMSDLGNNAF